LDKERIILGIDPGTTVMGYGVLRVVNRKPELITLGVFDFKKIKDHYLTLQQVFSRTVALIDEYHPDEMALEAPFFGKNVQSMLKLGRAQGVAMAAGLFRELPITEYAPLKIKMAITGNGKAAKEQVADMLRRYLKIPQEQIPKELDATDGLAAALCHFFETNVPKGEKKYNSWKDFAAKNEAKIKTGTKPLAPELKK
jgi:crossover junction endodeoxyribonuclease RuvC